MRSIGKHIPAAGRVLLLLFLMANSGFTMVLYHCTMCADPAPGCCERLPSSVPLPGDTDSGGPDGSAVARYEEPCMVVTIAGGLLSEPSIVGKAFPLRSGDTVDLLPVAAAEPLDRHDSADRTLSLRVHPDGSPFSVEKCVLNSVFRI
jgi:hypothetical protein